MKYKTSLIHLNNSTVFGTMGYEATLQLILKILVRFSREAMRRGPMLNNRFSDKIHDMLF